MDHETNLEAGPRAGLPQLLPAPTFALALDSIPLRHHDVAIRDYAGEAVYLQEGVEAPASWSERAVTIVASKYFYGDDDRGDEPQTGGRESSILDLHSRVSAFMGASAMRNGVLGSYNSALGFAKEVFGLTITQAAAFNSPVWFNAGLHDSYGLSCGDLAYAWDPKAIVPYRDGQPLADPASLGRVVEIHDTYKWPQCSACFIQSVQDNMESLMKLARNEAMLFKHGSGTGTDFSMIRSKREKLSGGGKPSGPLSFMKVYDRIAATVKSGGKCRRAAKMQTMGIWHPDILDFIRAKGREEKKAKALIAAGWSADFNGEAYDTVSFQNANFSVRVTNDFLNRLENGADWTLRAVTTGEVLEVIPPLNLWYAIAEETWQCGDPGLQFETTINAWHTCPYTVDGLGYQPINSSNPCSEYLFIDDSACNLASLNLMKFLDDHGRIDIDRLVAAVRVMITAMESLVDAAGYPTPEIAQNSHDFRTLGLGFANLGGLLQASGIAYASAEGRFIAGCLASIIGAAAYGQSARLAARLGPFAGFAANREPMLTVIDKHWQASLDLIHTLPRAIEPEHRPLAVQAASLSFAALDLWEEAMSLGRRYGYRHAQVTCIAPTGTIAFAMDCDTTGIEPNLSLVANKKLAGGGSLVVANRLVDQGLKALGYSGDLRNLIEEYVGIYGTAEGCHLIRPEDQAVFDTSFAPPGFERTLRWQDHLLMMAAVQPFVSGSISKTVNMPATATVADIMACYKQAGALGLKCVAIYRDESKGDQPLSARGHDHRIECKTCGKLNVVPAGTCGVCTDCGSTTGCS